MHRACLQSNKQVTGLIEQREESGYEELLAPCSAHLQGTSADCRWPVTHEGRLAPAGRVATAGNVTINSSIDGSQRAAEMVLRPWMFFTSVLGFRKWYFSLLLTYIIFVEWSIMWSWTYLIIVLNEDCVSVRVRACVGGREVNIFSIFMLL